METQIKSYIKTAQGTEFISIFGYRTKGVPGLEICGIGNRGRNIKEKIIYLTKIRKLKIPLNRYVITVDTQMTNSKQLKWVEFPILLVYWYLAGQIPMSKLDNCFCSGWITPSGDIFQSDLTVNTIRSLYRAYKEADLRKFIFLNGQDTIGAGVNIVSPKDVLGHLPGLNFRSDYIDKSSAMPLKSSIT